MQPLPLPSPLPTSSPLRLLGPHAASTIETHTRLRIIARTVHNRADDDYNMASVATDEEVRVHVMCTRAALEVLTSCRIVCC
jgi:hypothetical protein